jgi:hypothetical protein
VQCEEWVFDGKAWVPKSGKSNRQIRSCRDLDVFNLGPCGINGYVNRLTLTRISCSMDGVVVIR